MEPQPHLKILHPSRVYLILSISERQMEKGREADRERQVGRDTDTINGDDIIKTGKGSLKCLFSVVNLQTLKYFLVKEE